MSEGKLLILKKREKLLTLLIHEGRLLSVSVYEDGQTSLVGNIYIGKVQSIAANINAAFVEIENKQLCFLPLSNITPQVINRAYDGKLRVGDELLVQVLRDAVKTKQPVLTTKISIAGSYLAIASGSGHLGLSSKLSEAKKKEIVAFLQEKGLLDEAGHCNLPEDMGMVVRTNVEGLPTYDALVTEWQTLTEQFMAIRDVAAHRTCFSCLRKASRPYLDDLKNYYTWEFDEIITDSAELYEELLTYQQEQESSGRTFVPIRYYQDDYPLEKLYRIKTLLEGALSSRVWLKSGAYLVIEPTEALTVIDVNTGKCEAGHNREETFFQINREAAEEIAHQLRLRNLSGIILVDFINMDSEKQQKELLKELALLVKKDAVKTSVVDMTPLGLVEITRKRINRPLGELLRVEEI